MLQGGNGPSWLDECLAGLSGAKVAVFGDFCLDAYWMLDDDESERSVETGLPVRRVRRQCYSLGGAGNIAANLAALRVGLVRCVGLVGGDLFGQEMLRLLRELNRGAGPVDASGLLVRPDQWQTMVYAKPYRDDREDNRLDFGAFNELTGPVIDELMAQLASAADACDVVILNQQVPAGVSRPAVIERINRVVASRPATRFIADSRHHSGLYRGAMLKLNAHEAVRLAGQPRPLDQRIGVAEVRAVAAALWDRQRQAVFITRGENGLVVADGQAVYEVPGIQILQRIDPVGAGDTIVATVAAALAGGRDPLTAARLAGVAASVTVRKLQTTGTASPEEIRAVGPQPDYIYLPELADDPRQARYADGTEIELVRPLPPSTPSRPTGPPTGDVASAGPIAHALFDHDGTLSTLRQGWEQIMGPMMVRAVLGPRYADADESLYHQVADAVERYIDRTTGIQTLVQMQGLIELVRRFRCVPDEQVLDAHGYKAIYNQQLLETVRRRVDKLARGELCPADFAIKNASQLLRRLHERGVTLYLASGTDQADVVAEAEAMGYAAFFEGRIFGAVGDINVEAKKTVLERIIREHGLAGRRLVAFGDGPVEIRLTHKCGGLCVGVASDEVRRFGLNPAKRSRLIRAGADLIVPDYSQLDQLLGLLGLA